VGRDPNKVAERGRRFYMDYGFVRASNEDFDRPTKKKDRVIEYRVIRWVQFVSIDSG
jgi:hypothetical protein